MKGALSDEWEDPQMSFAEAAKMDPWNEELCEALGLVFAKGTARGMGVEAC